MTGADFGRATQARFLMDAHARGLLVSLPFDSFPGYDALVDSRGKLYRVQVKGAHVSKSRGHGAYRINLDRQRRKRRNPFDILAVWLDADNRWVLLPARRCHHVRQLWIYPTGWVKRYSDNWGIFR